MLNIEQSYNILSFASQIHHFIDGDKFIHGKLMRINIMLSIVNLLYEDE